MKFIVEYEVPPMDGIFKATVNANREKEAEEKIKKQIKIKSIKTTQ